MLAFQTLKSQLDAVPKYDDYMSTNPSLNDLVNKSICLSQSVLKLISANDTSEQHNNPEDAVQQMHESWNKIRTYIIKIVESVDVRLCQAMLIANDLTHDTDLEQVKAKLSDLSGKPEDTLKALVEISKLTKKHKVNQQASDIVSSFYKLGHNVKIPLNSDQEEYFYPARLFRGLLNRMRMLDPLVRQPEYTVVDYYNHSKKYKLSIDGKVILQDHNLFWCPVRKVLFCNLKIRGYVTLSEVLKCSPMVTDETRFLSEESTSKTEATKTLKQNQSKQAPKMSKRNFTSQRNGKQAVLRTSSFTVPHTLPASPQCVSLCDLCDDPHPHFISYCENIRWTKRSKVPIWLRRVNERCPKHFFCFAQGPNGDGCRSRGHYTRHCPSFRFDVVKRPSYPFWQNRNRRMYNSHLNLL